MINYLRLLPIMLVCVLASCAKKTSSVQPASAPSAIESTNQDQTVNSVTPVPDNSQIPAQPPAQPSLPFQVSFTENYAVDGCADAVSASDKITFKVNSSLDTVSTLDFLQSDGTFVTNIASNVNSKSEYLWNERWRTIRVAKRLFKDDSGDFIIKLTSVDKSGGTATAISKAKFNFKCEGMHDIGEAYIISGPLHDETVIHFGNNNSLTIPFSYGHNKGEALRVRFDLINKSTFLVIANIGETIIRSDLPEYGTTNYVWENIKNIVNSNSTDFKIRLTAIDSDGNEHGFWMSRAIVGWGF